MRNLSHIFVCLVLMTEHCWAGEDIREIAVIPESLSEAVLSSLPIKEGLKYDPQLLRVSKKLLDATDRFENVDLDWDASLGRITVKVSPIYRVENFKWEGDRISDSLEIERRCIRFDERLPLSQERLSQINQCLVSEMQERSYLDASFIISADAESRVLTIAAQLGKHYTIGDIAITGIEGQQLKDLLRRMKSQPGKYFQSSRAKEDSEFILRALLRKGYYFAEVFQPVIEINAENQTASLRWRVERGKRFAIEFFGDFTDRKILNELIDRGESFSGWFAEEIQERIIEDMRAKGHIDVEVLVKKSELEEGFEEIRFITNGGPKYLLEDPDFIGVSDERVVRRAFDDFSEMGSGENFNRDEYRKVVNEGLPGMLYEEGYLDVQVQGLDFVTNKETKRVKPIVYLSEGEKYRISQRTLLGLESKFSDLVEWKALAQLIELNTAYQESKIQNAIGDFKRALAALGYLDAQVEVKLERSDANAKIRLTIIPGPAYRIAKILVRGTKYTRERIIRAEVLLREGDIYSEERIRDGVSSVLRLGLARSLDVRILEKDPERGLVYVLVDLNEANRFRFEFGPGFGTLDGVRIVFKGIYANILGTGRRLSLFLKANRQLEDTRIPQDVLDPREVPIIERRLTVEYFEPSIFTLPVDGRLTYSNVKETLPKYSTFRNVFEAAADYRLNRRLQFITSYELEFSDPFNVTQGDNTPVADERAKTFTSINEEVRFDYVDDTFNPIKGFRSNFRFSLFSKNLGGDHDFWRTSIKQDIFYPLIQWSKKRILGAAVSLNPGFSAPLARTTEVPVEKRFYAGGETSVRGFDDQSINPRVFRNGEYQYLVGGNSVFYFQSEINVPIAFGLDFLAFFDGGNVYDRNTDWKPWDLRLGAGPGIRWNTPVGPLKLGYGFNLARRHIKDEREPLGAFYFGVGPL